MNTTLLRALHLRMLATVAVVLASGLTACAKKPEHASYATPEEATTALLAAVRSSDTAALARIFGPGAEGILTSGDPVADSNSLKRFAEMYDAGHSLAADGDDKTWLEVGTDGWPMPVPIVKRDGRWQFDGAAGADEIVYRRVGNNELGAIAVCRGYVDAQFEYASKDHDGEGSGVYAHKLLSDPGTQNGLYWETAEGEEPSPVGPFVAAAAAEGYHRDDSAYHGYRFRPLFGQSDNASGGALDYFDGGVLKNGFALVAWPAEYGVSGVMTFIVNQDGVVFQKDLGEDTPAAVAAMETYDPDSSWTAVVDIEAATT